jgi:hypothetical protein
LHPDVLSSITSVLDSVALNPQPLPPRHPEVLSSITSVLDSVALNPQPLPPRHPGVLSSIASALDSVALNPQPLPPRESSLSTLTHLLHSAPALSSGQLASLRTDSLAARGIIVVGG